MGNEHTMSPWKFKPWWCQPWSIVLTGTGLIAGSWWLFHRIWLTAIAAVPVLIWMLFFLVIWPKLVMPPVASGEQAKDSQGEVG